MLGGARGGECLICEFGDQAVTVKTLTTMARRKSWHIKRSPWSSMIPPLVEGPPFGQGLSLTEKMYARKFEKSESGSSQCNLHYAAFALQGFRKHMQDDYQCIPNYTFGLSGEPCASFAVYDGHGERGHIVSSHCAETFLSSVYGRKALRTAKFTTNELIEASIHKTFVKFDQQLREYQGMFGTLSGSLSSSNSEDQLPLQYSGTTVTSVYITDENIIFANLGDSRSILCRNGQLEFETTDHSPAHEDEAKRIKAAGGRIHTNPNKHTVIMDPDLTGNYDFSISRALGDFAFKMPADKQLDKYIVSPIPNISIVKRDYQSDQFILLASDGIFKSLSSEEVVRFIHKQLQCTSDIPGICRNLVLTAYYSYENIPDDTTVVLIVFPAAPKVNSAVLKEEEVYHRQSLQDIEKELKVLVSNSEDVRILDNEFGIFLELTKKLPQEYKVQLRMDFFRETLDSLRVEHYGTHSSKKIVSRVADSNQTIPGKVNMQKESGDSCDPRTSDGSMSGLNRSEPIKHGSDEEELESSQTRKQDSRPTKETSIGVVNSTSVVKQEKQTPS